MTPAEFWRFVNVRGPDDCWLWRGACAGAHGYGRFMVDGVHGRRCIVAHRQAYLWAHGLDTLPSAVLIRHRCANARCVNPAHLFVGHASPNTATLKTRFWAKVHVGGPDECWVWQGATGRNGYGHLRDGGRYVRAHRVSYMWAHGLDTLAPDLYVCHRCDTPGCVNPAHLFTGTQADNMADCKKKGRLAPPVQWPECIPHQAALKARREARKR